MKVLTVSVRAAAIITVIFVAIITVCIALLFGGTQINQGTVPEIEIILPGE